MNKSFHIIYKTTCIDTGQYYVGRHSTNNLDDSYLGSGVKLKQLISQLGKEKFSRITLVEAVDVDSCKLLERTIVNSEMLNDPLCLNAIPGGGGQGKLSAETKRKISEANKGRVHSLEARARMSAGQLGKQFSDDTRRKMAVSRRGKKHSDETKEKIADVHRGAKRSEQSRKNMSDAQAGKTLSLEHRAKIGVSNVGKNLGKRHVMSSETKEKISRSTVGRHVSEETKIKMSIAAKLREELKRN